MLNWVVEHWIAVGLLGVYTLFLFVNAVRGRRQTQSMTDYYVGGRRVSGWVVGVSFCATYASTNSYVGNAGKGYSLGAPWLLFPLFMLLFTWLSWTTVAPRLREFTARLDALTLPDYLARRYASTAVGRMAAIIVLFASVLYLVAIFKGAGNVLQIFLAVDYEIAVLVTLLVVVLYTSLGGFLSVARTDVVQGAMMLAGSLMIGYFVVTRASELSGESGILGDARLTPMLDWNAGLPFAVLLGIILSGSLKLLVDPRQVSRFFALEDQRAVRSGMLIAMLMVLLIQLGLFPVGVLAHLFFDSAPGAGSNITDTDMIMPLLLQRDDVFPFWASDVLLVAIVAAAMSSMDSVLLVAASVCVRDLLGGQPAQGLRLTRIAVVGLAVLAAIIALRPPGDIVAITIFSGSLYAACFLPVLLLSLHWSRGHAAAVLGSMLTGIVVLLSWLGAGLSSHMHEVFPALLSSALVFLGMSSLLRRPLPDSADWVQAERGPEKQR